MRLLFFISGLFLLFITGCAQDSQRETSPFLIFGKYHNFCLGDCWILYKIEGDNLYADTFDHPRNGDITFSDSPMSFQQYESAVALLENLPDILVNSPEDTYGCPDCADQGGYYVSFVQENVTRVIHLDTRTDGFQKEIIEYLEMIEQVLEILSS